MAAGLNTDDSGASHAYEVNQATRVFTAVKIPGSVATGINNNGDTVGFYSVGTVFRGMLATPRPNP